MEASKHNNVLIYIINIIVSWTVYQLSNLISQIVVRISSGYQGVLCTMCPLEIYKYNTRPLY